MSTKVEYRNGMGFGGALGIAFIVLKLCHVIDWSWWLVLLPIYGPIALILSLFICIMLLLFSLSVTTSFFKLIGKILR